MFIHNFTCLSSTRAQGKGKCVKLASLGRMSRVSAQDPSAKGGNFLRTTRVLEALVSHMLQMVVGSGDPNQVSACELLNACARARAAFMCELA